VGLEGGVGVKGWGGGGGAGRGKGKGKGEEKQHAEAALPSSWSQMEARDQKRGGALYY